MTTSSGPSPEARGGISDLFARYAWAVDTGDIDLLESIFTPDASILDAVFDPPDRYAGRAGIRKFGERFRDDPYFPGRQHYVGQSLFEGSGAIVITASVAGLRGTRSRSPTSSRSTASSASCAASRSTSPPTGSWSTPSARRP